MEKNAKLYVSFDCSINLIFEIQYIHNIFHYVLLLMKYMIPYTIHCIKQAIKVKCITPCGPHQEEEKTKADSGGKTRLPAPQLKNN